MSAWHDGDFALLERALRARDLGDGHWARQLIDLYLETGRDADALAVAEEFERKNANTPPAPGTSDGPLFNDPTSDMLAMLARGGAISADDYHRRRDAWVHELGGRPQAALPYLERATHHCLARDPRDFYYLGMAKQATGDRDGALAHRRAGARRARGARLHAMRVPRAPRLRDYFFAAGFFGAAGQPFFASSQWQRTFENSPELSVLRAVVVAGHSSTFVITFVCSNGEPSDSLSTHVIIVLSVPSLTLSYVFLLPCMARSSTPALQASAGTGKWVSMPANL